MNKILIKKLFDKAHQSLCRNDFTTALECYYNVMQIDPSNDGAAHFVAFLQNVQGEHRTALEWVNKAIDRYPCNAAYYTTLANVLKNIGQYRDAVVAIRQACQLLPDGINFSNAAMILTDERRYDRAKELYQAALELEPECPFIHFNYSLLLLLLGEFEAGWKEYDWRIPFHYNVSIPEYPDNLKGKKIQIIPEQGFGDFLMFARYFRLLEEAGAEVYMSVPRAMFRLFPFKHCTEPDHQIMLMSLPQLFKEIPSEPYIKAPGSIKVSGTDFKVGVAHKAVKQFNNTLQVVEKEGNIHIIPHPANLAWLSASKRSLPHDFFDPFFRKGVQFYNLQIDTTHYGMLDVKDSVENFADLADWVDGMDIIITIDTALAHLAGGMGKPVWLLLPYDCDWRWGVDKEDSVWYPSMKIFRQKRRGNWDSVQDEVIKNFPIK